MISNVRKAIQQNKTSKIGDKTIITKGSFKIGTIEREKIRMLALRKDDVTQNREAFYIKKGSFTLIATILVISHP